jgi:hypothetical protein
MKGDREVNDPPLSGCGGDTHPEAGLTILCFDLVLSQIPKSGRHNVGATSHGKRTRAFLLFL